LVDFLSVVAAYIYRVELEIESGILALASRKRDDLEDHVVSSTSRNRYYHRVLGLRVKTLKGNREQGNSLSEDA
jgi:hypothetical protein